MHEAANQATQYTERNKFEFLHYFWLFDLYGSGLTVPETFIRSLIFGCQLFLMHNESQEVVEYFTFLLILKSQK